MEEAIMDKKLQAKDLINLGLFTVLYFVLGCCVAIPIGFVPVFLPILGALWSLITGIPFMLFLTRVKKFGMVTLMGILSGLLMGLTGMGFWGVPMGVIFGLLGDMILKSGGYSSAKKSLLGYAVFSLWMTGLMNIVKPVLSLMPFGLILSQRRLRTAGKYLLFYAGCFLLERIAFAWTEGLLSFLLLAMTSVMTRFAPGIMTGAYLVSSTTVSEFVAAMERMHISDKIVIPLSVIFRFFPTVGEEYGAIRDAMKMRGIRFGGEKPFLMVEYRLIPLMVSVVKIGDELSAAALTRGLGGPVKRTNICRIGFHSQDIVALLLCAGCFAAFFWQSFR